MPCQQLRRLEYRQPHHAAVAARNRLDENAAQPLDGVSARLVPGFPTLPVSERLVRADVAKFDRCDAQKPVEFAAETQRYRGHYLVGAPGERLQHTERIVCRPRLAENSVIDHDDGIGSQDRQRRVASKRLFVSKPDHHVPDRLTW